MVAVICVDWVASCIVIFVTAWCKCVATNNAFGGICCVVVTCDLQIAKNAVIFVIFADKSAIAYAIVG